MKKLLIGLSFCVLSLAFAQGARPCLPELFPSIYNTEAQQQMQELLKGSDAYKVEKAKIQEQAISANLPDTFVPTIETTVSNFLATEKRQQRQYILRLTDCLVEQSVIMPLEKQAIDRYFEAMLQDNPQEAQRAAKFLAENATTNFAKAIHPSLNDIITSFLEAQENNSNTGETQAQSMSGAELGGAIGTVVGAISGGVSGGLGGALVGATLGAAVGKAVGGAVESIVNFFFGGGDEEEEEGNTGGDGEEGGAGE